MTNAELLDNNVHRYIKITASHLDSEASRVVKLIHTEFKKAAGCFPIFLSKTANTDAYVALALLGLDEGENLFVENGEWTASYIPLDIQKKPFMLGENAKTQSRSVPELSLFIDMKSKRVTSNEGERIFNDDGTSTRSLDGIQRIFMAMIEDVAFMRDFVSSLIAYNLVIPMRMGVSLTSGESKTIEGLYGINEERLNKLSGEALEALHKRGYLNLCFYMIASYIHIDTLCTLKNKRIEAKKNQ